MNYLRLAALLAVMSLGVSSVYAEDMGQKQPAAAPTTVDLVSYSRLYTGDDGETHFQDVTVTFAGIEHGHNMPSMWMSTGDPINVKGLRFFSTPAGWDGTKLHPAPKKQFFFVVSGIMEFKASDGEARSFGPGSILLVEDTSGKGHTSRMVSQSIGVFAIVPLADESKK